MNWNKQVLRSVEDEGAGGAGSYDPEGGSAAPNTEAKLSAFEQRLAGMANQLTEFMNGQRQNQTRDQIAGYERQLTTSVADHDRKVSAAEAALSEAFDGGEGPAVAKAQRLLSEAIIEKQRAVSTLETFRAKAQEAEKRPGGSSGAPGSAQTADTNDTANLNQWKSKHKTWYGVDADMTKAAHAVDARIREAGAIPVGSKEYFGAIDREMAKQFPDRFGGTPPTMGASGGATAGSGAYRGRIPQSVISGWARMGINTSDPKTIERMMKHRQTAVGKGMLPQEPISGGVVQR